MLGPFFRPEPHGSRGGSYTNMPRWGVRVGADGLEIMRRHAQVARREHLVAVGPTAEPGGAQPPGTPHVRCGWSHNVLGPLVELLVHDAVERVLGRNLGRLRRRQRPRAVHDVGPTGMRLRRGMLWCRVVDPHRCRKLGQVQRWHGRLGACHRHRRRPWRRQGLVLLDTSNTNGREYFREKTLGEPRKQAQIRAQSTSCPKVRLVATMWARSHAPLGLLLSALALAAAAHAFVAPVTLAAVRLPRPANVPESATSVRMTDGTGSIWQGAKNNEREAVLKGTQKVRDFLRCRPRQLPQPSKNPPAMPGLSVQKMIKRSVSGEHFAQFSNYEF